MRGGVIRCLGCGQTRRLEPPLPRNETTDMRIPGTATSGLIMLAAFTWLGSSPIEGQVRTYHPRVSSITPQSLTPGRFVTVSGTDLIPPTWTAKLQYHDKYGGGFHEI